MKALVTLTTNTVLDELAQSTRYTSKPVLCQRKLFALGLLSRHECLFFVIVCILQPLSLKNQSVNSQKRAAASLFVKSQLCWILCKLSKSGANKLIFLLEARIDLVGYEQPHALHRRAQLFKARRPSRRPCDGTRLGETRTRLIKVKTAPRAAPAQLKYVGEFGPPFKAARTGRRHHSAP